jgi:putative flippase GtrA
MLSSSKALLAWVRRTFKGPVDADIRKVVREGIRYVMAGVLGFTASIVVLIVLVELVELPPATAAAISFAIAFVINFTLARYFIFPNSDGSFTGQLARFGAINFMVRSGEYFLFLVLIGTLAIHYALCLLLSLILSNLIKFFVYRAVVFGDYPGKKGVLERQDG